MKICKYLALFALIGTLSSCALGSGIAGASVVSGFSLSSEKAAKAEISDGLSPKGLQQVSEYIKASKN